MKYETFQSYTSIIQLHPSHDTSPSCHRHPNRKWYFFDKRNAYLIPIVYNPIRSSSSSAYRKQSKGPIIHSSISQEDSFHKPEKRLSPIVQEKNIRKTFISAIKMQPCPVDTRISEIYYTKKGVDWLRSGLYPDTSSRQSLQRKQSLKKR